MRNILVSVPSLQAKSIYLPSIWAMLKTHAEQDERIRESYLWLDPIYRYYEPDIDPAEILKPYDDVSIDVLALSCYVWNWKTNIAIAGHVKRANPDCLIVAGGPQIPWSRPGVIDSLKDLDIVVKREGEVPFTSILAQLLEDQPTFDRIPNLILRGDIHTEDTSKMPPLSGQRSPLLAQADRLAPMVSDILEAGDDPHLLWETNRGCPYKCSFCDWGVTGSKVRKFDLSRLNAEADWISRNGIHTVFVTDANYGIFERDFETATRLVEGHRSNGHPRFVLFNPTKGKQEIASRISRMFYDAGIFNDPLVNIQHTDPEVLKAIDRKNIQIDKLLEPILENWVDDFPVSCVLIAGNPMDNYRRWKACLDQVMEWGFHEDIVIHDFAVLPNAPAADTEYRARFGIRTVNRIMPDYRLSKDREARENTNRTEFIVATYSFDEHEWVRMKLLGYIVSGLHVYGSTRFVGYFLRYYANVHFGRFYSWILDEIRRDSFIGEALRQIETTLMEFLRCRDAQLYLDCDPSLTFLSPPDQFLFHRSVTRQAAFYDNLGEVVLRHLPELETTLADLIEFQSNVVVTPEYDPEIGRCLSLKHNWAEMFAPILRRKPRTTVNTVPMRRLESIMTINERNNGHLGRNHLGFNGIEVYHKSIVRTPYMRNFTGYFRSSILAHAERAFIPLRRSATDQGSVGDVRHSRAHAASKGHHTD
ncbi:MAG: hypothetical protein CMQ43_01485 [Gammaproteobacteria bacterium]|nr:hypothetical protein [Gammaproteobacteria bacterium]